MTYSSVLRPVMLGLFIFIAGCVAATTGDVGVNSPAGFASDLNAADQAIARARQRGEDKNCPEKFQELVKLRDEANKKYLACCYREAKEMAQQVVSRADALDCAPKVSAAPVPVPAPVVAAPVPAPAPAAKDSDGDGVLDPQDKCPGTPRGVKVDARGCWVLTNSLFDFDKSDIKPQYEQALDEVVEVLKKNPGMRLEIQGYADRRGSVAYNQRLSERRANAVKAYFENKGIEASRLTAVGFGKSNPVATNATPEGMAENRRVELKPLY